MDKIQIYIYQIPNMNIIVSSFASRIKKVNKKKTLPCAWLFVKKETVSKQQTTTVALLPGLKSPPPPPSPPTMTLQRAVTGLLLLIDNCIMGRKQHIIARCQDQTTSRRGWKEGRQRVWNTRTHTQGHTRLQVEKVNRRTLLTHAETRGAHCHTEFKWVCVDGGYCFRESQ